MNDASPPREAMTGLEFLRRYMERERSAPLGNLLGFYLVEVGDGYAVFEGTPTLAHYNPHGVVHGGWASAMLDSALGCAVQTKLSPGLGYGTVELKINFVRPMTDKTGLVRCRGDVVHVGRRMATSEARLVDGVGRLYAHGSCTCFIHHLKE